MSNDPIDQPIAFWRNELPGHRLAGLELSGRLRSAEHEFAKWRHEVSAPLGIDPKEWDVLSALWRMQSVPVSMSDLSADLLLVAGSVTHRVSGLERRGLVQRSMDPDSRRRVLVTLTDAGADLVRAALPAVLEALDRLESAMSSDSIDRLNVLLRELHAVLTAPKSRGAGHPL